MSNKIFKTGNQSVKFKALTNMLAGNASSHAVKHFEREMTALFGTDEQHELPTAFVNEALQEGKIVVLFNARSWIITASGTYDVDFLVLRHTGEGIVEYYATRANNTDSNSNDEVQVEHLDINKVIHAINDGSPLYNGVGSLRKDYKVLAFTNDAIYTPDWTLETLPEGWERVVRQANRINRTGAIANNSSTNQETKTMSNVKNTATVVAAKNKSAVVAVAKLEAGRIAIKQVSKVITPKLPMMVRGYADSEIGRLVMANLFNFAVTQFAPNNANAQLVADAMLEGAMLEMLQKFNFEEMINEVVNKVDISKLTNSEE